MYLDGTDLHGFKSDVNLMRDGALLDLPEGLNATEVGQYKKWFTKTITGELVIALWTNPDPGTSERTPLITWASGACDSLDYKSNSSVHFPNVGPENSDAGIDYNGSCYGLIDVYRAKKPQTKRTAEPAVVAPPQTPRYTCQTVRALYGATHDMLNQSSPLTDNLTRNDLIVTSVEGRSQNGKSNGFPMTSEDFNPLISPGALGTFNITACDYHNNRARPGIGCPILDDESTDQNKPCAVQSLNDAPLNNLVMYAGDWTPDLCKVQWTQYNYSNPTGENMNPIDTGFQLLVAILDKANKVIGNAVKQYVTDYYEVWNSPLPYIVYIGVPGFGNFDTLEFWYHLEYWRSDDHGHSCDPGSWDNGARRGHCLFACPKPDNGGLHAQAGNPYNKTPKIDVTIQHTLPFRRPIALHNFTALRPQSYEITNPGFEHDPTTDWCWVRVTQFGRDLNGVPDFQYQAYRGEGLSPSFPIQPELNAQVPASPNVVQPIFGAQTVLFNVSFNDDGSKMRFMYRAWTWDSEDYKAIKADDLNDKDAHACKDEISWKDKRNIRQVVCNFVCKLQI